MGYCTMRVTAGLGAERRRPATTDRGAVHPITDDRGHVCEAHVRMPSRHGRDGDAASCQHAPEVQPSVQESITLREEQGRDCRGTKVSGDHRCRRPALRGMRPMGRGNGQQNVEERLHANGEHEKPNGRTPAIGRNRTQRDSQRPEEEK